MKKIMLSLFSLGLIFFVFSTTPTQAQCSPVDSTVCPIDYQYCCATDPDGSNNGLYCHFEFYWCFNPPFWNVYDCNCNAAACGYGSSCPAPTPTPCVPDGSCSAPPPACEQTTTGTDNCGNPCSLTGPACPTPPTSTPAILSGRVVDQNGTGLVGVTVILSRLNSGPLWPCSGTCNVSDLRSTTTDGVGSYSFSIDTGDIVNYPANPYSHFEVYIPSVLYPGQPVSPGETYDGSVGHPNGSGPMVAYWNIAVGSSTVGGPCCFVLGGGAGNFSFIPSAPTPTPTPAPGSSACVIVGSVSLRVSEVGNWQARDQCGYQLSCSGGSPCSWYMTNPSGGSEGNQTFTTPSNYSYAPGSLGSWGVHFDGGFKNSISTCPNGPYTCSKAVYVYPDLTASISCPTNPVLQGSIVQFTTTIFSNASGTPGSNTGLNVDGGPNGQVAGVGSYPANQNWSWTSPLSLGTHTATVYANLDRLIGPGGINESNYSNNTAGCNFDVVSFGPTSPPSPPPTSTPTPTLLPGVPTPTPTPTLPPGVPTPTPTTPPPPTPTPTVPTITCSFTGPTSVVAGSINTYTDTSTANNTAITSWAWTTTAGSPGSGIGSIFNWTAPSAPGTYPVGTISLTVNDGNVAGPQSCTNSVPITVSAPTPTPTPSVLSVDLVVDNDPTTVGGPSSTKDITNNTSHSLTWSSTNTRPVNPCTASSSNGLWTGSKPANDSVGEGTGNLSSPPCSYSYTLTCFDSAGASRSDTVNLNIQACLPWLKTTGGDVHTNTNINTPGGP